VNPSHQHLVDRLVRWRDFQEEQARTELHAARQEAAQAASALGDATARLENIAAFKARSANSGCVDPGLYGELLAYESIALAQEAQRKEEQTRCEQRVEVCQASVIEAKSRSKVAHARQSRYQVSARDREEKRSFDLVADQWMASRNPRA
jgi:hypothetical protein